MENRAILTNREVLYLPIDVVKANPYQPRKFFERASLQELSNSIREYGVIQPITVRLINGFTYELVAGERRLRACKMAGISSIPAIIVNINDEDSAVLAIIENLQRQNLNFLEEAEGYRNLIEDYKFTQDELAQKVGKSQSSIANKLRVLRLSPEIHNTLLENDLTERHARALLRLETEKEQLQVLGKIINLSLTVKKTDELVERILQAKKESILNQNKPSQKIKRFVKDIRIFTNTISQAVEIMNCSGVATDYIVEEKDGGCDIFISVKY